MKVMSYGQIVGFGKGADVPEADAATLDRIMRNPGGVELRPLNRTARRAKRKRAKALGVPLDEVE